MATKKRSAELLEFVRQHPAFFDREAGYLRLRSDLTPLLERYARTMDPAAFERVRGMVEQVRREECDRLQEAVAELSARRRQAQARLKASEAELVRIHRRIDALRKARREADARSGDGGPRERGRWYQGPFMFWTLAFLGVLCVYAGVLAQGGAAFGFLFVGAVVLGLECYHRLSARTEPSADRAATASRSTEVAELERALRLAGVMRAALGERKIVARKEVERLDGLIEENQRKVVLLNG